MLKNILKGLVILILQWEAKLILKKYRPKIVAITGSVGKTSVKEAVFEVLKVKYKVRQSAKSYNSELGVPLTIINRQSAWDSLWGWLENIFEGLALLIFPNTYPDWLILEIGADRPGDIKKVASWVKPNLAIITRLPDLPVHIEFFPSKEVLIKEKFTLAESIGLEGIVILNIDDKNIQPLLKTLKVKTVTYGFSSEALVRGSDSHIMYNDDNHFPDGMVFKLNYAGKSLPVRIKGALGQHHIYTALAACATGIAQEMNEVDVVEAIGRYQTPPGRMRLIAGIKQSMIIDDTYNASPAAMEAGILTLGEMKSPGRKIAVLGDMLELGEHTIVAHKEIGVLVADKVDQLILVGPRSKFIAEGAKGARFNENNISYFTDSVAVGKYLQNEIKGNDIIYIKGSQMMRMEKTVEEIMLEPEKKEDLLCRQEPEWQKR